MEILIVAAELSPYTKAGEAGDSIASLSRMLAQLGHAVTVALPRYSSFEAHGLLVARRLTPLRLPSGDPVTVFDGQLGSGVKLALFDAPDLYTREGVYEDEHGKEYSDNARRFGLLAQAATALAARRASEDQPFDVAHLHDWPGALTAVLLAQAEIPLPKVLTLHDVERAGSFAAKELEALGISPEGFTDAGVKQGSRINVLKGGVLMADFLTTVSPTYAEDLAQPEQGGVLASAIAGRKDELMGIVNGLDYAIYNPAVDTALVSRYNAENPANKGSSKTAVLRQLELDIDPARPVIVAAGELSKAGGFELLIDVLPRLLSQDVTVIVGGTASSPLARAFASKTYQQQGNYAFVSDLDSAAERRLLAAADFALALEPYDRTGSFPRKAQRYGTAPVAYARGAVKDTVVDADPELETGTGFVYEELSADALYGAVARGLTAFKHPSWPRLVRRLLRLDLSWDSPARRYLKVYKRAMG
jgi:starch synthase